MQKRVGLTIGLKFRPHLFVVAGKWREEEEEGGGGGIVEEESQGEMNKTEPPN